MQDGGHGEGQIVEVFTDDKSNVVLREIDSKYHRVRIGRGATSKAYDILGFYGD
jgi:hypothetical protein